MTSRSTTTGLVWIRIAVDGGYTLGIVARELALDIADAIYEPQMASHVPGVANVGADLSPNASNSQRALLPLGRLRNAR